MANPSRCGMSSEMIPPEGSPSQPSAMEQHQRDYGMRRAISCSPNIRAERLPHNHTSLSAVNTPLRPRLSGPLLGLPPGQIGFGFGSLEQHGASRHLADATYSSLDNRGITLRQFSDYAGGPSALGFEPGPEVGYTQTEMYLGNQQDHMPPALVFSTDDLNSALEFASAGMTAGTYGYSDSLGTPDKLEPEQWENSPVTVGAYMDPNRSIAPSFYQPREPVSTRGQNFLSAHHPWGLEPPSSPSAYSPSSASPISAFSGFGLNSPRSTMGDMDESGSSRTCLMQEYQVQGERNWRASSRAERVPVSPSSPSWSANQAQPFGCELFPAIPPMTPASANTASIGTPDPLNTTNLPASIMEDGSLMAPIPTDPQPFLAEGPRPFTCLTGGPSDSFPTDSLGAALQSEQTEFMFSISPGTHGYQPSNVSGTSIINSPPSEIPCISRVAGPSFSTQVNTSYARAVYGDCTYQISSMGASGSRSAVDIDAAQVLGHPKFKSTYGSTGRKCGRHRATSRANEVEKVDNNRLLHMSISALVDRGLIQQVSALRETLRLIIQNCFLSDPTRQEIVDLLFDALPYDIRVIVTESGVKKYYKERVGHILSAPANKNMFINSAGGRWSLGMGPSH